MTLAEAIEYFENSGFVADGDRGNEAWSVIKTALAEAQKTPTNSKSMPLCDGCNKPFPELICYCDDCLDHVVRMGA